MCSMTSFPIMNIPNSLTLSDRTFDCRCAVCDRSPYDHHTTRTDPQPEPLHCIHRCHINRTVYTLKIHRLDNVYSPELNSNEHVPLLLIDDRRHGTHTRPVLTVVRLLVCATRTSLR